MVNPLDDHVLKDHLQPLEELAKGAGPIGAGNPDAHLVEQLQILRSLAQRRAFSLNDRQIAQINSKFTNFSFVRKLFLYNKKKRNTLSRVEDEMTPEFSPVINDRSRALDQYASMQRRAPGGKKDSSSIPSFRDKVSVSPRKPGKKLAKGGRHTGSTQAIERTNLIYSYAEKYEKHRKELQEEKEKREQKHKFEPKLNPKSVAIAQGTGGNFTDRTMAHYINKVNRHDRDPNLIEYEKQQEECTFKPTISSASRNFDNAPGLVHSGLGMNVKSSPRLKKRASQPLSGTQDVVRRKPVAVPMTKHSSKPAFERLSDDHMAILSER